MSEFVIELPPFVAESDSDTSVTQPDGITEIDHTEGALSRLVQQFRNKPNIRKMIQAFTGPMVQLEQAFVDIIVKRALPVAVGDQLLQLAKIVGQEAFDGLTDDDLRRYVRARILTNRSNGTGPQIINISRLVIGDDDAVFRVWAPSNAAAAIEVEGVAVTFPVALILINFLRQAIGVGIRIVLEWLPSTPEDSFTFEGYVPGDEVGLGFLDFAELVGGDLGSEIE